jgi:hypothetical protein
MLEIIEFLVVDAHSDSSHTPFIPEHDSNPFPLHAPPNLIPHDSPLTPQLSLVSSDPDPTLMPSRPSRIPEANSLDDVLRYWETGAPDKGLMVPLKQWPEVYDRVDYLSEEQKLSNIRFVQDEFTIHCSGDWGLFAMRFPDLRYRYTKLLKAVREARKERGSAKSRKRARRHM